MLRKKLMKLGLLTFVLAALVSLQPRTATAALCCSACSDNYETCIENCVISGQGPTCAQRCLVAKQNCARFCDPSC